MKAVTFIPIDVILRQRWFPSVHPVDPGDPEGPAVAVSAAVRHIAPCHVAQAPEAGVV